MIIIKIIVLNVSQRQFQIATEVLIDEISKEVDKRHLVPVRYNINTMTNDFEKLEKEIREIKQDQYTIKNQLYLLAMLTNHSVERPLAHIIDRILPPNQSKKTTNTIKPYYSGYFLIKKCRKLLFVLSCTTNTTFYALGML